MGISRFVLEVDDFPVALYQEQAFFPAANPQFTFAVLVNAGDIPFLNGVCEFLVG